MQQIQVRLKRSALTFVTVVLSFSRSASTLASDESILIFDSISVSLPPKVLVFWFVFMMADRVYSGILQPQACTCVT